MDVLTYLQPKERSEYEALKSMFETEGWAVLQAKLKEAEEYQLQSCAQSEDERALFRGQGRLIFLREMLNYEAGVQQGVEALALERQIESELEAESPGNEG